MQKQFKCEVHTANGQLFEVTYQSTQVSKEDAFKPINIIREVRFSDYVLSLGQLRERTIWHEIMDAVDNNSYSAWELYHKEREGNSHVHPVFQDIFDTLGGIFNPALSKDQLDNLENISQQGQQC